MGVLGSELPKVLARKRRAFRFTQADLGKRISVSGSYISSLESGKSSPRVSELEDLAVHFRTTAMEMLQDAAGAEARFNAARRDDGPKLGFDAIAEDLSKEHRSLAREFLLFLREREHGDEPQDG